MEKQLTSILLFAGVSFIVFTGFKKDNSVSSSMVHNTRAANSVKTHTPSFVTITGTFDFSTFPDVFGTFTTSGALTVSGDAEMVIGLNENGARAHCVVTLTASDGSGTITIHQECAFNTPIPQGRWEVVSGTGAYANLKGNGPLTMPANEEAMTGVIY